MDGKYMLPGLVVLCWVLVWTWTSSTVIRPRHLIWENIFTSGFKSPSSSPVRIILRDINYHGKQRS